MKKQILITLGGLGGGGAERNLINFLNHFNRDLFHIEILCYFKTGVYVSSIPEDVPIHYLANGNDFLPNKLKPIRYKLGKKKVKFQRSFPSFLYKSYHQKFDFELAFLHDIIPFVAKSPIQNKVGFLRNDIELALLSKKKKQQIIESSQKFNLLIAVSQEAKNGFVNMGGDGSKVKVIYNPIDVDNIREKAKESFKFPSSNQFNILAVGRLFSQKRYDRLIDAIHLLKQDNELPPFHLSILGKGPLKEILQEQINQLNLGETIELLGYDSNPYKLMKNADLITLSSDFEGLPGVICEALTLAKPIVATNAAGVNELLKGGELGIITEKSSAALAEGIKKMILDDKRRQSFEEQLKTTSFPFDKKVVMPQLEDLYLSV